MKKIVATATAIVCALLIACSYTIPACAEAETSEFYWRLVLIISCEDLPDCRLLSCEDRYGMVWQFYDDEFEWNVGDYGTIELWVCTEDPYDDEVIDTMRIGHTEKPEYFWHFDGRQ